MSNILDKHPLDLSREYGVTTKQARLVQHLVAGENKRQAAIKAGYSNRGDTPNVAANRALRNDKVLCRR